MDYQLTCPAGDDPAAKASAIAYEQTVELPHTCLTPGVVGTIVGRVESLESMGGARWRARLSYPVAAIGGDFLQLLNVLFGNISLQRGIRVTDLVVPDAWLANIPGPSFGIAGIRQLLGAEAGRALSCAAIKPLGLSATALAQRCGQLARGGIDIVKDDHGLVDQPSAPFGERVERCQEAVERVNAAGGGPTLYAPNVTATADEMERRLEVVRAIGCRVVLVSPLLVGWDTVRVLAARGEVAILAHPSLTGAFFHHEHGIAQDVFLGVLFRLIGSDAVIYPNAGGRFPMDAPTCVAVARRLRQPLGALRPAFPMPGGGIDLDRMPAWLARYGPDTIFLIGSSLYSAPDLEQAANRFAAGVRGSPG